MKLSTPKNFSEFAQLVDQHMWLRMIVCFLPGLVIGKLANGSGAGSALGGASTVLLAVGVAVFLLWPRIRAKFAGDDELDEGDAIIKDVGEPTLDPAAGRETLQLLAELRALCGEEERESDRLVALEVAMNPDLTLAEATQAAIGRKRLSK